MNEFHDYTEGRPKNLHSALHLLRTILKGYLVPYDSFRIVTKANKDCQWSARNLPDDRAVWVLQVKGRLNEDNPGPWYIRAANAILWLLPRHHLTLDMTDKGGYKVYTWTWLGTTINIHYPSTVYH